MTKRLPKGDVYDQAWQEVTEGTDRVSALLAAAWLDLKLESCIKDYFPEYVQEDDCKRLLGAGAPLASFGARCNLVFALGAIGPITKDALQEIGRIRNVFAHAPHVVSFSTPEITIACNKLVPIIKALRELARLDMAELSSGNGTSREVFLDAALGIYMGLMEREIEVQRRNIANLKNKALVLSGNVLASFEKQDESEIIEPFLP